MSSIITGIRPHNPVTAAQVDVRCPRFHPYGRVFAGLIAPRLGPVTVSTT